MSLFRVVALLWFSLFVSCSDGDKLESYDRSRPKKPKGAAPTRPPLPKGSFSKEELLKLKASKLVFPKTLCGRIVGKIFHCETARITGKYANRGGLRKSKAYSIEMRFKRNLKRYLAHCQRTARGLDPKQVDTCLALECKAMDRCMKTLQGTQKTSGKKE